MTGCPPELLTRRGCRGACDFTRLTGSRAALMLLVGRGHEGAAQCQPAVPRVAQPAHNCHKHRPKVPKLLLLEHHAPSARLSRSEDRDAFPLAMW